ncbi:hypothetical protein EUU23_12530 [Sphingorhabdus sp. IMCC26285]|jgi:uncharacterized DUF497 family protein|uniref:BrnT family toxin n=1 Tax=Sphingorhabdus profundilacus TaxID=2509718 RepID=A0A6I4M3P7_9SPHN|nr:BrnT family toxin [Sphingorhabdus profundilacus]MVZ98520.1 hypothetical protein [Sphingorhabdus profundilacus]
MIIVWDEPKRLANIDKHGIDFADIDEDFFLSAIVRPAKDGRYAAIGEMDGMIVVIFVVLGREGISIVSVRPANRRERSLLA